MLAHDEYFRLQGATFARPEFSGAYPFEEYIEEKRDAEDWLRTALSVHWKPGDEFEVASDENVAFTLCGNIYAPRVICREYLAALHRILGAMRAKERWSYHTSVELGTPPEVTLDSFFLQNGTLYVLSENLSLDFVACFSRNKDEAERDGPALPPLRIRIGGGK
jgi:hypothetical protein